MNNFFQVILIKGTQGTEDITRYYLSGASFSQSKQFGIDQIEASDVTLSFSNIDNYFTETLSNGIFYNKKYLNKWFIEFKAGTSPNNLISQFTGIIKSVDYDFNNATVNIYLQDTVSNFSEINLNPYYVEITKGTQNVGNGEVTNLHFKPFCTKTETITVSFTSSTTFQVTGSVSGNMGTGIVGEQFIASGSQCKFEIRQGDIPFRAGDQFFIHAKQLPEFFAQTPMKVVWAVLTGYDYDTNTLAYFYDRVLRLDRTKGTANKDIDYQSFLDVLEKTKDFKITGYIPFNKNAKEFIEEIISIFLGSIWIENNKIKFYITQPQLGNPKIFNDNNIISLNLSRNIEDIYNEIILKTKIAFTYQQAQATFAWTDEEGNEDTDKLNYVLYHFDLESVETYGIKRTYEQKLFYLAETHSGVSGWGNYKIKHLLDFTSGNIQRIKFTTFDGFDLKIGQTIRIESERYGLNGIYEIFEIQKDFSQIPFVYTITAKNDTTSVVTWAFLGSNLNEGDGLSPQASNYDNAKDIDKYFCYLSDGTNQPKYYVW